MLVVNTYPEKDRNYEPATHEIADLKRYVDYKLEKRYLSDAVINGIRNLSVTSLCFETYNRLPRIFENSTLFFGIFQRCTDKF
jgi:hypothetical protein